MHITNIFRRVRKASPKQLVIAAAFMVALASAVSLGLASKQKTSAASFTRDCTANAIDNKDLNGGCGAATPAELVADARANNPGDLQAIYAKLGLPASEYDRFASEARQGIAYRDGRIVVDGQVVATNSWSIGRSKKANSWNWNGYWADSATNVNRSDVPVMVMFNANGEMQAVIMNPCGNPGGGEVVKNRAECTSLTKTAVAGKKDTYSFKTAVDMAGNASIEKVVYNFGDGTTATKTDLSPVEHTFTRSSTVTVTVTFKLPGGKTKVDGVKCKTQVTVLVPFYLCVQLTPRSLNEPENTQFRFTVKTSQGNGATLKDADFTLDGANTTTGVTAKDEQGNIYKDYTFAKDGKQHKIVAKVNFNVADGVKSKTCEATVTSTKAPVCEKNPQFPPDAPECNPECKPGVPVGHPDCTPPQVLASSTELPKTGMGSVLGLFAGTSVAGAAIHRIVTSRRRS